MAQWTMRGAVTHEMLFGDRFTFDEILRNLSEDYMSAHGAQPSTVVLKGVRILRSATAGLLEFQAFGIADRAVHNSRQH